MYSYQPEWLLGFPIACRTVVAQKKGYCSLGRTLHKITVQMADNTHALDVSLTVSSRIE